MKGLCSKDCNRCTNKNICGGCSLCEASICSKICNRCSVLCGNRLQSIAYINFIGGTEINLKDNKDLNLQSYNIPLIPNKLTSIPKHELMPLIAVHGGNMFSANGEKITKSYMEKGVCKALNLDNRTEALLEFYVRDRTLEGFWDNRNNIYENIKKMNFKAVITPNFSLYEDVPRMDHLYNIKRSEIVYNEMIDAGINAVPDIVWFSMEDIDRWCNVINKSSIKIIAFSFQVVGTQLKASNVWKSYLAGFRYMCSNIDKNIKIIIAGINSSRRIHEVARAASGHSLYIINQTAYIQSRRGIISENRTSDTKVDREILLEKNIKYFNEIYNKILSRYRREGL